LAKNTGTDSFFIQKMAFSFLILSLFYLVTDSDRTIIAYNRIAKEYVKAYRGFFAKNKPMVTGIIVKNANLFK
ncbi:hypothetical protein ACT453_57335, partial [Bacillus sp. D-CC]